MAVALGFGAVSRTMDVDKLGMAGYGPAGPPDLAPSIWHRLCEL